MAPEFTETFTWTESSRVGHLHFSAAKRTGLQPWDQQLSWTPEKAQQFRSGPRLEELHVVLRDEAGLSIQSPLQPARLLRWMNIVKDGARRERELRVMLSLARIQGFRLPEWCAVWKQAFI